MASKDFSNKLKDLRLKAGYSQKDVYEHFKIPQSTFSSWEVGKSEPSGEMLIKLCEFYKCDMLKEFSSDDDLNYKEWNIIEKYRFISEYSADYVDIVDSVLDKGYSIAKQISEQKKRIQEQQEHINQLEQRITSQLVSRFILPLYRKFASAGSGEYLFDDIPTETIEVADTPAARKADFVIGVSGKSMEPDFYDGENVFVEKVPELSIGDVGIFVKGSECFIKELGTDRLISRNKAYEDITGDENVRLVGKVIGKVER